MKKKEESDPLELWLSGIENSLTLDSYKRYVPLLIASMRMTPQSCLEAARGNVSETWLKAKAAAKKISSERGRLIGLYGLRKYWRVYGLFPPADGLRKAKRKRPLTEMTWEQALKLSTAAEPPYNLIFKLMLHTGIGTHEFLEFNTQHTWTEIREYLRSNPEKEYFSFTYMSRKTNEQPFRIFPPAPLLKEIFAGKVRLPFVTKGGAALNLDNYRNSRAYVEAAFRRARKKAGLPIELGAHDFRDTFKTVASRKLVAYEVKRFVMGHAVDAMGYDHCWNDSDWVWRELSKMFDD